MALHRRTCWYTTEYEEIISMQAPMVALMCQCLLITVKELLKGSLLNLDEYSSITWLLINPFGK